MTIQTITPNQANDTHSSEGLLRVVKNLIQLKKSKPKFDEDTCLETFSNDVEEWQGKMLKMWAMLSEYPSDYCLEYQQGVTANGAKITLLLRKGKASEARKAILALAK